MRKYIILFVLPLLCACNQTPSTVHSALVDSLHMADTAVKPVTKAHVIVPGKSVGLITINGNADSLANTLGKPDSSDAAMGASTLAWNVKYKKGHYRIIVYSHRNMGAQDENVSHIKAIYVNAPYYKTADYSGAGSSLRDIRKLFKLTSHAIPGYTTKQLALYNDYGAGISFEADSTGRCHGILVYARGDSSVTYINMLPHPAHR
ncbi:MAG: hypothetical protein ACTHNW_02595 [Mucilaginibacter sp.]